MVALSRVMTLADVSELTYLSWDTVKGIVQKQLQHDYGQPRRKDLKSLAIDEIYVGKRRKFYTLVLDLEAGRIVWVGHGRGQAALGKFWRRLRLSKAKVQAVAMDSAICKVISRPGGRQRPPAAVWVPACIDMLLEVSSWRASASLPSR